jgi:CheY-like chemotaxis protein
LTRRKRPPSQHVLVIDDDRDSREIVRQMLEWGGIEVKTASGGREGIRLASSDPPAVVFLDLDMPQMSGVEVLRALRRLPETSTVAVAALTGVPEALDSVADIKFDWVLTKPVPADQLVSIAKALIATAGLDPADGGVVS